VNSLRIATRDRCLYGRHDVRTWCEHKPVHINSEVVELRLSHASRCLTETTGDGAFNGAVRAQSVATGGKWECSRNGSNARKPLPWVATGCRRVCTARSERRFESVRGLRRIPRKPACQLVDTANALHARALAGTSEFSQADCRSPCLPVPTELVTFSATEGVTESTPGCPDCVLRDAR
jgi:hypothetical protein